MTRSLSKKITVCSALTAVGLILGYIESFIVVPVGIPGIRIGSANIATVMTMYMFGPGWAFIVSAVRVSLSSLLFGSPVSFMYGLCGTCLALSGMYIMKKSGFSVYGVSAFGAVMHNIGQTAVAAVFTGSFYVFSYLSVLIPAGVFCGLLTGFLSDILIRRLGGRLDIERKD